jgi:type IV pilus assembly protein PilA
MKRFLLSLKRQSGFTLVELMVVVAIIGLLSAVAIPNFRKYQAKSKMSEAKLQLSSLYTAESAFFSDFNIYSTCLSYMGYNPSAERPQRYYAVGFNVAANTNATAFAAAVNSGLQTVATGADICSITEAIADGTSHFIAGKGTGNSVASTSAYLDWTLIGTQADNSSVVPAGTEPGVNTPTGMIYRAAASGVIDGNYITGGDGASAASLLTIDNNKRVEVRRNGY